MSYVLGREEEGRGAKGRKNQTVHKGSRRLGSPRGCCTATEMIHTAEMIPNRHPNDPRHQNDPKINYWTCGM